MKGWPDRGTEILAVGLYAAEDVRAIAVQHAFDPGEMHARAIEEEWAKRLAEAEERGGLLYDGPLLKMVRCDVNGHVLRLLLQPTSYKMFVGTNMRNPSLPAELRADPLGNSAVVVSADDRIVLGRRSTRVHGHPGRLHCIGGHVEHGEHGDGDLIDTFASIVAEATEELAIEEDQIVENICLGIVRDVASQQPEQVFRIRVDVAGGELRTRGSEHESLVLIENSREEVERFIDANADSLVPVARACLLAHARLD